MNIQVILLQLLLSGDANELDSPNMSKVMLGVIPKIEFYSNMQFNLLLQLLLGGDANELDSHDM